ncbi:hypothetical protein B2A_03672, partial [mine drainage metagenome]
NLIALFIGDTGSGKSYSAIRLAERVDPNFSVARIVFTVKEFLDPRELRPSEGLCHRVR